MLRKDNIDVKDVSDYKKSWIPEILPGKVFLILRRRHPRLKLEGPVEGGLAVESGLKGRLEDGGSVEGGVGQTAFHFFDTIAVDESGKGNVEPIVDKPGQLMGRHGQRFGERLERHLLIPVKMIFLQGPDQVSFSPLRGLGRKQGLFPVLIHTAAATITSIIYGFSSDYLS